MSYVTTQNLTLKRSLRGLLYRRHAALALLAPGMAFAGPTGEDVVGGEANIVRPDVNRTVINQVTDRAAINWQTFNIDADEYVIFNQPGASSIVLNRVLGGDASYILGHMQANGQVFLLNPNGVYFTHGASLDVQGFLGATLDMDPNDFMAGDFSLSQANDAPISRQVINDGVITAGPGGYVVLAGDYTENTGVITANAGSIALVSGNALTLDIEGDGLVNFAVDQATVDAYAGVRNTGSLIADGGRIVMTAKVANDLVATAVNNEGLVRARSVEERDGEIYLVGIGADVVNSGTLDADGENADGGRIGIYSDRDVILASGALQTATGGAEHSGGTIRAIAENHLDFQQDNTIRVSGAPGAGGFVEVSGHGSIALRGIADLGSGGTLLIDPSVITIQTGSISGSVGTIGTGNIQTYLNSNNNVILAASSSIGASTGVASISATGTGNLTMGIGTMTSGGGGGCLYDALCFGPAPTFTPAGTGNINLNNINFSINGDLVLNAGPGGTVTTADLTTTGGRVSVFGGSISVGNVNATTDIEIGTSAARVGELNATGNLNAGGNVDVWTDNISGSGINIAGGVNGANINLHANGSSGASANVTVGGVVSATSNITLAANGPGGNVILGSYASAGGNIDISAMNTGGSGGNVQVAWGLQASGNINVNADGGSSNGGNITISGGGISASSGSVTLSAGGGNFAGGNITVVGAGPKGIAGANGISLTAIANGVSTVSDGAVINVSGQVQGGNGNVMINANNIGGGQGGSVLIAGNASNGQVRGQAVSISAENIGSNGGRIQLGLGSPGSTFGAANVTALGGNIDLTINGGQGVLHAGALNATGNITLGGTALRQVYLANYSGGVPTLRNVNAGGNFSAFAGGSNAVFEAGDVTANNATINVTAFTPSGGDIKVGNISGTGSVTLNATGNSGGGISAGAISGTAVNVVSNMSASVGPGVTINGPVVATAGNATFNVNNTGGPGSLTLNGDVTADGNLALNVTGLFNNTVNINGDVNASNGDIVLAPNLSVNFGAGSHLIKAGGDIAITSGQQLLGSTSSVDYEAGGNFAYSGSAAFVARNVTGSNSVSINANGSSAGISLENVSGNTINLTAVAGYGGGSINVAGVTGGTLAMSATGGSMGGGNVAASGNIAVSGNVSVNAAAAPGASFGGDITLQGVSGNNIDLIANGDTSNAGLANIATGNINATGNLFVDARFGSNHAFGNINARHIDAHFTPAMNSNLNVSMGTLAVNGTSPANRDIVVELNMNTDAGPGGTSNGSLTIAGANAQNGEANFHILPEAPMGGSVTGNFTANGAITAARRIDIAAPDTVDTRALTSGRHVEIVTRNGDINTRAINVSNTVNVGAVVLDAGTQTPGANIFVDGDIAASGRPASFDPLGAVVDLVVDGGSITVTGNINVTATGGNFSNGAASQGFMGAGLVRMDAGAGGMIDTANIGIDAVGRGFIQVSGENISIGNITQSIADGNISQNSATSICSGVACNLNGASVMDGAQAHTAFFNTGGPGATLNFGDVNMSAGNASFVATDFSSISGGAMTLVARGLDFAASSTGTYDGQAINFSETHQGGGATVYLAGSSNGVVQLTGAVDLQARGNADLMIMSDTIKVRGVTVETSAGTFERTGQPAPLNFDDGPFTGGGLDAGPQINEGTITGGGARVSLSGYASSGSYGYTSAGLIEVNGAVSMAGAGHASLLARGNTVTVTGNIALDAGAAQQDGTFAHEFVESGASVQETGTVVSDWGNADVDISASGNVTVANISVTGPGAGGRLEGTNIRAGSITVNATGGSIVIDETSTVDGVSEQMHFEGPNTFTGFGLRADNTLELTGAFTLNAVGAGGALMSGTTIKTRDITINVADGDHEVLAPDTFGATTNTFTAGNALLGIVGATAQVNGNVSMTASQQAHFGGAITASGNFDIEAGTGITRTIPATVQFLNAVDSEDGDATITLPAAFNVQANNIRIASAGGTTRVSGATLNAANALAINGGAVNATGANLRGSSVDLAASSRALTMNGAAVNTPGALTMSAGTDILVSNVNLNADTVQMTAGRDVLNSNPPATITTEALAISAGRNVDLANTTLVVGDGSFADITGDADFLQLLAAEEVVVPATGPSLSISANNIALGNLDVAGGYIYLETNQLQLNGTVNTGNPDLLLQVAPTVVGTGFGFEDTTTGAGTSYLYDGTLNAFDAATIALGTTSHTGDVTIGSNGGIDIGDTNLFVLTTGTVSGLGRVSSTGIVKDLATLINGEFNVPQTDEIDTRQDLVQTLNNDYALESTGGGDEEEEGDEEGEDTDTDTDIEEEDDSLIRQDTVDEEMMCR